MLKSLAFVFVLFLSGCDYAPPKEVELQREIDRCIPLINWANFWHTGREGCIRGLNYDYNSRYYYNHNLPACQRVVNEWKNAWTKIDKRIMEYARENNESLPENFKTAEEIFREYPNPCQDNDQFWKEVKEYEKKQKQQRDANKT